MCTRSENSVRLIRNIFLQMASDLRVCFGDIFSLEMCRISTLPVPWVVSDRA